MKLILRKISFHETGSTTLPTWIDVIFDIDVPPSAGVAGEMAVSIDMTREAFEGSSISDLAQLGETEIRNRAKL